MCRLAQFVRGDIAVCLIRASKVQKIGVYDTESGIKPRPGVTHLLNHGNLLIFFPVCTPQFDTNAELGTLMERIDTY